MSQSEKILIQTGTRVKKAPADLDALYKKESQRVKVRFRNLEMPGGKVSFPYRKYEQDPLMQYELEDGKDYELPVHLIKHLNNNVGQIEHKYLLDSSGRPTMTTQSRKRRFMLESLEFIDMQDLGTTHIDEVKSVKLPPLRKK